MLTATALRTENTIEFNVEANDAYSIVLRGINEISNVEGASFELSDKGIKLIPNGNVTKIVCNM